MHVRFERGIGPVALVFHLKNVTLESQRRCYALPRIPRESLQVEERLVWSNVVRKMTFMLARRYRPECRSSRNPK